MKRTRILSNQWSWPQPIPLSVGQEAFPREKGGGARVAVGPNKDQAGSCRLPSFGSRLKGLIVDSPGAKTLVHISISRRFWLLQFGGHRE